MKLIVLRLAACALLLASTGSGGASERLTSDDYLALLRIDLRAAKAGVVAESLELTPSEAERFWPLYREYDEALSRLNARRIDTLRDFAHNYASIDQEKARELSRRTFDFMHRRLGLLEKYSRKIEHATSPVVAARFAQVETQLLMLIDVQLAAELPLIPREAIFSGM